MGGIPAPERWKTAKRARFVAFPSLLAPFPLYSHNATHCLSARLSIALFRSLGTNAIRHETVESYAHGDLSCVFPLEECCDSLTLPFYLVSMADERALWNRRVRRLFFHWQREVAIGIPNKMSSPRHGRDRKVCRLFSKRWQSTNAYACISILNGSPFFSSLIAQEMDAKIMKQWLVCPVPDTSSKYCIADTLTA